MTKVTFDAERELVDRFDEYLPDDQTRAAGLREAMRLYIGGARHLTGEKDRRTRES